MACKLFLSTVKIVCLFIVFSFCNSWLISPGLSVERSRMISYHDSGHTAFYKTRDLRENIEWSAHLNNYQRKKYVGSLSFKLGLANSDGDDKPDRLVFQEENDRPVINARDFEAEKLQEEIAQRRRGSNSNSNNDMKRRPISSLSSSDSKSRSKVFGSLTAEELTRKRDELRPSAANRGKVLSKIEDLNGIDPFTPLIFSVVPAGMAVVGWQVQV